MKTGIYLGPPLRGALGLGRLLAVFAVIGTLFHLGIYLRQVRELAAVRSDVERRAGAIDNATPLLSEGELSADGGAVLARLGALSEAGVSTASPTTVFRQLFARALPD